MGWLLKANQLSHIGLTNTSKTGFISFQCTYISTRCWRWNARNFITFPPFTPPFSPECAGGELSLSIKTARSSINVVFIFSHLNAAVPLRLFLFFMHELYVLHTFYFSYTTARARLLVHGVFKQQSNNNNTTHKLLLACYWSLGLINYMNLVA